MEFNVAQFKKDFLEANVLPVIQKQFDVIFVWLAGSSITGLADDQSDLDLGVLIADDTAITRQIRNEDYLIYKPTGQRVQWIYDTVEDITTLQTFANQRNIGWAQVRYLKDLQDDFIIYINPKYTDFVQKLLNQKYSISEYSMWLYFNTKQSVVQRILKAGQIDLDCRVKSLYHLCWVHAILFKTGIDREFLVALKRSSTETISQEYLNLAFTKVKQLSDYFKEYHANIPEIHFERK